MTKRKPNTALKWDDPATKYRAKLKAKKAATREVRAEAQGAGAVQGVVQRPAQKSPVQSQSAEWSPSIRDRGSLAFARLLHTATAPHTRTSGVRKRFLERWVFRAVTRHAAHRRALHRTSKAVISAARAENPPAFLAAKIELHRLWQGTRTSRRKPR